MRDDLNSTTQEHTYTIDVPFADVYARLLAGEPVIYAVLLCEDGERYADEDDYRFGTIASADQIQVVPGVLVHTQNGIEEIGGI